VYVTSNPFRGNILIKTSSIAIWEKNKCLVAIAASLWVINVGVMIQGMSSLTLPADGPEFLTNVILPQVSCG